MTTGPDVPAIQCYESDQCGGLDPCAFDKGSFLFTVRSLLPQSQIFNHLICEPVTPFVPAGAGVGCFKVGCQQLVFGSYCGNQPTCYDYGQYPQLAVFDAFAAGLFDMVTAVCQMLKELSPCTAEVSIQHWAARYGLRSVGHCAPPLTEAQVRVLACAIVILGREDQPLTAERLRAIAGMFGVALDFVFAGDFSDCNPYPGWWTMARPASACAIEPDKILCNGETVTESVFLSFVTQCADIVTPSINIVMRQGPIHTGGNCNAEAIELPPDPDLYEAFKILLARLLPRSASFCVYAIGDSDCDFLPVTLPA